MHPDPPFPRRTLLAAAVALPGLLSTLEALAAPTSPKQEQPKAEPPKIVAYVPNWIDLAAYAKTIPYQKLTHINIAFENPKDDDGNLSWNPKNDLLIARARQAKVKVLLALGGGGINADKAMMARYAGLLGAGKVKGFCAKIAQCVAEHKLDGVDVDIEGPAITDDYGRFIEALRAALPKGACMTAALSMGYGGGNVPDATLQVFDWVNAMAYDAVGPWAPDAPGQHAPTPYAKEIVQYWLKRGLPAAKLTLGVPFYGYGFGADAGQGTYSYREIVAKNPGAQDKDQVRSIWYNGRKTIADKANYAREQKLAGIMIWSLDSDAPEPNSLLTVIHKTLNARK